ncbi:glycosyltransferase [Brumicola pallidula]|uniref:Glycosyl transferase family 1 domain-containing protein n=1 Tax=Brumicola pallidula DSM 14239 = ACAM 615 TaxID=1121922 RepID=K6ZLX1_9ALTE|nr:glycosyltransferase [Glaciecola pallidula]GAC29873.1 hypothetical protein GPAL_3022 [Glaciecola pallidula DSM 14239 = ACAM 615]
MKSPKTVCFVNNLAFRDEPTIENRLLPYIIETLHLGHKVILISSDNTPILAVKHENFTHICCPIETKRPNGFLKRAFFENKNSREILKKAKGVSCDIYLLTIPSMFLLFNARILKNHRVFLDVRDLTWHYLSSVTLEQRFARLFFEFLAKRNYEIFEKVAVTNEAEALYFKSKAIPFELNYNGITQAQFNDLSSIKPKIDTDNITVTYVGKVGVAQNLDFLIRVAKKMPDIVFKIVGYGPLYKEFQHNLKAAGVPNILAPGSASWKQIIKLYEESDILYAQLTNEYSGAMPSKLYQYLCASRFIVYGGSGQAKKMLDTFSNNIVVEPNSVQGLVEAITHYIKTPIKNDAFEKNSKRVQEFFIREENVKKITESF